ncbi:MAG: nucleoid-associated protein [Slackia sp.]|nr:nucleoid-associated protein [Slackia sp.]
MHINHAIVHVFDFSSSFEALSDVELDLDDRTAQHFVAAHVRRAMGSIDNRHGSLPNDGAFADEMRAYRAGRVGFAEFSVEVARFLGTELAHQDKASPADILIVDFEESDESASDDADSYDARDRRYFGVFILESKQAYMHDIRRGEDGAMRNGIVRGHAVLPNTSQKVSSYAIVDIASSRAVFNDKPRSVAGEQRLVVVEGLLQCSVEASGKDVIETVARIVEEVAEEYGANAAIAVSKAKAHVVEAADEDAYLAPWDMASDVFEDEPLRRRFEEAVAEECLPERVPVEKKVAQRVAKSHKIRTDTGIEITFPAEYGATSEYIEFFNAPDGTIQIELKNIGSIENR